MTPLRKGKIILEVNNESLEFDVFKIMNSTQVEVANRIDSIDILDECVDEVIHEYLNQEPIKPYKDRETPDQLMEVTSYFPSPMISRFEPLRRDDDPKVTTPGAKVDLELKPLPSNLRYAFLNSNYEFSFIVNSSLSNIDINALRDVLLSHKNALGYSISDLKCISPKLCMHRILLEDNVKPSIKGQRRLNPTLKEVVRKEVIKLLDNGIIYSISDSN